MKKWMLNVVLVLIAVGVGWSQDNTNRENKIAETAMSGSKVIDFIPAVGAKFSLGYASDLGDGAFKEMGSIVAPAILATVDLTQNFYLTGEMAMSQWSIQSTKKEEFESTGRYSSDLKLATIDPTLLIGYYFHPKISVFGGSQFNLIFKADSEIGAQVVEVKNSLNSNTISGVAGVKMHYAQGLFSDIRGQYGMTNLYKQDDMSLYAVMISAGIYF